MLGINDSADPTIVSLLGDTPGSVGLSDRADPSLRMSLDRTAGSLIARLLDGTLVSLGANGVAPISASGATVEITLALLKAAEPNNTDGYYESILPAIKEYCKAYKINTKLRIAHFLAQIAHESSFKVVEENGNYKAKRMREIFGCEGGAKNYDAATDDCKLDANGDPKRLREKLWTEEATYANNAKNLLNYVYASRMGNGDEQSGDGFRYRGRGVIQLTGKKNYLKFQEAHNAKSPSDVQNFVGDPGLLVTAPKYGIEAALFFWDSNAINALADADDLDGVTRKINGGTNGLSDRKARLERIKTALEPTPSAPGGALP